jgi:hypothetical protein
VPYVRRGETLASDSDYHPNSAEGQSGPLKSGPPAQAIYRRLAAAQIYFIDSAGALAYFAPLRSSGPGADTQPDLCTLHLPDFQSSHSPACGAMRISVLGRAERPQ